nr:MAG TPA: hypothetical protein [Caudoviricetes sp.]DAQ46464.1 MAG TPA: hypothetical protein [Caudoviricetes sp.]
MCVCARSKVFLCTFMSLSANEGEAGRLGTCVGTCSE